MKHILITSLAALLLIGCSDPEAEANKLFTEASNIVKEANRIENKDILGSYMRLKSAVKLIETIPEKYPQSSLAVKISEGNFNVQGKSIDSIKQKFNVPDVTIHDAAKEGDLDAIKRHLGNGTDVHLKNYNGVTPLRMAAGFGHKEICEFLIDHGGIDHDGCLQIVIFNGNIEIADLLIKIGFDVNFQYNGKTALDSALKIDYCDILAITEIESHKLKNRYVELLRKHGAKTTEELEAEQK